MARKRCRKCRQPVPEGYVRPTRPKPETSAQRNRRVAREARQKALAKQREERLVDLGGSDSVS